MAKLRKKGGIGTALISTAIGVGGGIVAKVLDTKVMPAQSNLVQAGIKAGVGAILPIFMDNTITNSLSSSLIGVAGYQIANEIGLGDASTGGDSTTKVDGFPPAYTAVTGVHNQWVDSHTKAVNGTTESAIKTSTM